MLIREPSDSLPWLIKGGAGRKSVVIMFLKKKEKRRGELKSVIGSSLRGCLPKLKVWYSNQNGKLEASDLHGLTGVGHNLPTGQWHHWGFEGNFDSSFCPSTRQQSSCSIVKEGPGLRKPSLSFKFTQVRTPWSSVRCHSQYSRTMFFNPFAWKHRGLDQGGGAARWAWGIFTKARLEFFISGRFSFSLHFLLPFFPFSPLNRV